MTRAPYRFYYPGKFSDAEGGVITLPEGESHHLLHVLRLGHGAVVNVFDHLGTLRSAEVGGRGAGKSAGKLAQLVLGEELATAQSDRPRLTMAVSMTKRRAMDLTIEKLSELDVASVQPLVSRRSIAAAEGSIGKPPPDRWSRIALAAAKQAGRNIPMNFYPVTALGTWLKRERPRALACFCHAGPESTDLGPWLADRAGMNLPLLVAVGPEGGWTPGEVKAFRAAGFQAVGLGPLVLRAETAAITFAAACRIML